MSGRLAPPFPSIAATTSSSSATTRAVGCGERHVRGHALGAEPGEGRGPDHLHVGEAKLGAVLDRRPRRDVVPDGAGSQPELLLEPVVEDLLREREVDGLIDMAVGVEVAPAKVDALLVHR